MNTMENLIVAKIKLLGGVYLSDFKTIPKEQVKQAIRSLLDKGIIRQKEDNHDWEYRLIKHR